MNYFPTYLALGEAFCNRKDELKRLLHNIEKSIPSLIMSPRRYGKTSLVINTLTKFNLLYVHIDLYKALSKEDIEMYILNGIGKLLGKLETAPKKLINLAGEFFASMQIRVVLEKVGIALDFSRRTNTQTDKITILLEALEKLQILASQKKKKIILFLDEFQVVGDIAKDWSIEAVIREAAQKSQNVVYIFSGSNRHLMEQMFCDKKRPFYKLCDLIAIDKISVEDYSTYIQKSAMLQWGKSLDQDVMEAIFFVTERHAYYVNKLCSILWQNDLPNKSSVFEIWQKLILENKSIVERELELLSINQRKILILLAEQKMVKEPYGKNFATQLNISASSISRALSGLIAKDYVCVLENNYHKILDPLISGVLAQKK